MDMMLLGETVRGSNGLVYYGFWMPAQGNDGTGGVEVSYVSAASAFTVKLQTKTAEDADNPSDSANIVGSAVITSTTPGITRFAVADAKELVRYIILAGDESDQTLHFQFLAPQWADN